MNTKRAAVFVGPSLRRDEARVILDADYYPPAGKGDIHRVLATGVDAIILIDGVFHSTPSVWQRELLDAMEEGIEVLGASSMGALRAAELHPYGMIGYGTIFEWYRQGILDGDDEVALLHGPEEFGFRPMSEPLVNIRCTLGRAVEAGCVSPAEFRRLIAFAKRLYYPERSYPRLLQAPLLKRWPVERVRRLTRFLSRRSIDLKRLDAIGVLRLWARRRERAREDGDPVLAAARDGQRPSFALARASLRGYRGPGGTATGREVLRCAGRDRRLVGRMRRELSRRRFLLECARQANLRCPPLESADFVRRWEREHPMLESLALLQANGLTPSSYRRLVEERALIDWMERSGPERLGMKRSFILEWARTNGVRQRNGANLESWILGRGPSHFGLNWSFRANLLEELQVTGRAAELLGLAKEAG